MDANALALSEQATLDRFNTSQDRVARDFGYGQTAGALGVTEDCLKPLTDYIQSRIDGLTELSEADPEKEFLRVGRNLSVETIALCTLDAALNSVALGKNALQTRLALGGAIAGECWAAGLLEKDGLLAKRIERAVKRKHGSLKYRKQAARSIAAKAGYRQKTWERAKLLTAGNFLLDYVLTALPTVFTFIQEQGDAGYLTITDGALELAERAVELALQRHPVFFPCTEPPKPWRGWYDGGYWDERTRLRIAVVRTHHKENAGAIRAAIRSGAMQPHLDALNTLQSVAWTINKPVLEVLKWTYENGVEIDGLPPKTDVTIPFKPAAWGEMDEDARRLWKYQVSQIKERNRSYVSNRVLFKHDTETAELMAQHPRFYTPMNCDWRGRVYSVPHFNFQRDDRVRALFLFADGQPLGEDGLYWLKVHVANCGDFNKVSKRPFAERVAWTDSNLERIKQCVEAPCTMSSLAFWTKADKPFLFLAACLELSQAIVAIPSKTFITRLPISFDGSCSGLQHLAAMTRDAKTGTLVNLIQSVVPQDVYQAVADVVEQKVKKEADEGSPMAQSSLAFGITRKVVKRNVMTYSYSSKKFGMARQLITDLMQPLAFLVLAGKMREHPFGVDDGNSAAKYLASHIYDAIETLVCLPAQAMRMLQKCARALAHEGKPLTWTTPLGLPWSNRYHAPNLKRLNLWLRDTRVRMVYADGFDKTIAKEKAANGVAPNFVHALDAAHLLMVVGAAAQEGIINIATVHDSFGCLAPQAARFRQIIREQFVKLYEEHDVLQEVLEQAKHDLTIHNQQRLPQVVERGDLDLQEVLNADFAFA